MANTYDKVYQLIIDDTKRPDMSDIIIRRIQRAVNKYHLKDFWKRDLVVQIYAFKQQQALQAIDTTLLPRFRALKSINKYDPSATDGTLGEGFDEVSSDNLFDGYGYTRKNVMSKAGGAIHINSSTPIQGVIVSYYIFPQIEPAATIQSWIMQEYPGLIAAEVKQKIFADMGKLDEASATRLDLAEELANLYANNLTIKVS